MTCRNCGNNFDGIYCPRCGEKTFDSNQLSVKHFIEDTFEGLVHFDSKIFRSLKTLIIHPGELSLDYVEGRRVKYMKPVQLFVLVNVIFFIFFATNPFSQPLQVYISFKPYTNYNTSEIIHKKLQKESLSIKEYELLFNERMESNSKEFLFLFIPFYGILLGILFFRREKVASHLIFATHFVTFILLYFIALILLLYLPFNLITHEPFSQLIDYMAQYITITCIIVYLFFAIRKFYKARLLWTLGAAIFIGVTFFIVVREYRMLLFYKIVFLR